MGDTHESEPPSPNNEGTCEIEMEMTSRSGYLDIFLDHPAYRAYFLSHLSQDMGDWFVSVANLVLIEEWNHDNNGPALGHLATVILLPKPFFAPLGGALADRFDRRNLMIMLDVLSGIEVLGYLLAIHYQSTVMLLVVTSFRSALGAAYYPVKTGILPMLLPEVRDLQLAISLNSALYGFCSILGGLLAASLLPLIGVQACYVVDCVSFQVAAGLVWRGMRGNDYQPQGSKGSGQRENQSGCWDCIILAKYLLFCGFGSLILLNSSLSFLSGFQNILNTQYSTVTSYDNSTPDEVASAWNLGLLFSVSGFGLMLGPFLADHVSDARRPHTLLRSCSIGFTCISLSWLLQAASTGVFFLALVATGIRSMGTAVVMTHSTLLWQTLVSPELLGRVLATDFAAATLLEAASANCAGQLGWEKESLALLAGGLGLSLTVFWLGYYRLWQLHSPERLSVSFQHVPVADLVEREMVEGVHPSVNQNNRADLLVEASRNSNQSEPISCENRNRTKSLCGTDL